MALELKYYTVNLSADGGRNGDSSFADETKTKV